MSVISALFAASPPPTLLFAAHALRRPPVDFQLVAAMLDRRAAAAGAGVEEARGDQGRREAGEHLPACRKELPPAGAGP